MAWLKSDDSSAMHPLILEANTRDDDDEDLVNRVFGFLSRAAAQSAQHMTDYFVTDGVLRSLASPKRYRENVALAEDLGLLGPERSITDEVTGRLVKGRFIIQVEGLWHIRSREEIEWERRRKRENGNVEITALVRQRDGDACRYCGNPVDFTIRKGARSGTYDHLDPKGPGTPENLVVACRSCNSSKLNRDPAPWVKKMLPSPKDPFYRPKTLLQLKGWGLEPLGKSKDDRARAGAAEPHDGDRLSAELSSPSATDELSGLESSRADHTLEDSPVDGRVAPAARRSRPVPAPVAVERERVAEPLEGDRLHAADLAETDKTRRGSRRPHRSDHNERANQTRLGSDQDPGEKAPGSGFPGSGRVGPGRVWSGRDGQGGRQAAAPAEHLENVPLSPPRRKRKRSRRPKNQRRNES